MNLRDGMSLPRFYPILDVPTLHGRGVSVPSAAGAILEADAKMLQFRHKGDWTAEIYSQACAVAQMCREARAMLVVNDRADIALLLNCGVHTGQDDLPPAAVRKVVGAKCMLGFSTHNEPQLIAGTDEPVDYLALGPIFGTVSKTNADPVVGVEELKRLRELTTLPLVAIGGVTTKTAPDVWKAGADSIAVIGDLYVGDCRPSQIRVKAEEWMNLGNE